MSQSINSQLLYETHDRNDTARVQSRQPHSQSINDPSVRERRYSYLSSSSGSLAHSLRRTPRLDPQQLPRSRSASVDSGVARPQQRSDPANEVTQGSPTEQVGRGSHVRTTSASRLDQRDVHPALRISDRTASAILYTLEVGLRSPRPFTEDTEEENASMSDLLGASGPSGTRGTNGTARTGAAPTGGQRPGNVKTPIDIMRDREARNRARAQREQELQANSAVSEAEARRRRQEEELRQTAQRRSEGVTAQMRDSGYRSAEVSAGGFTPGQQAYNTPKASQQQPTGFTPTQTAAPPARYVPQSTDRRYERLENQPPGQSSMQSQQPTYPTSRARNPLPQDDAKLAPASQPTAMTTATTTARGAPPQQPAYAQTARPTPATGPTPVSQQAQPSSANTAQPVISGPSGDATGRLNRNSNVSSFPHAFERWETLSSRWEGLTSYWIRKLESNPQKADINQEMARQITDLAAAGANLFHAVVELQRLRASSERKFQRWFFETRANQEEAQEKLASLQRALDQERQRSAQLENARVETRAPDPNRNYERLLAEYKRELQISKDEARRAWEDLGRQEVVERERVLALREGHPIDIGGIQVVPHNAPSRGPSLQQRAQPSQQATTPGQAYPPRTQAEYAQGQYDTQGSSPTNTDPFSSGERQAIISPPATATRSYQQQQQPSIPTRATSRPQETSAIPPTAPVPPPTSATTPQQPRMPTARDPATGLPTGTSPSERFYSQPSTAAPALPTSYPTSTTPHLAISGSETEEEPDYELDASGHVRFDSSGNPIVARTSTRSRRPANHRQDTDPDDEYERARERRHARSAAQTQSGAYVSAGSVSTPTAGYGHAGGFIDPQEAEVVAGSPQQPQYREEVSPADYEGAGFGEDDDWADMQSRHHHPTRLSDVPEEDERSRGSLRSSGVGREYGRGDGGAPF